MLQDPDTRKYTQGHGACADEMSAGLMYVLLQIYSLEAAGEAAIEEIVDRLVSCPGELHTEPIQ